jgi:acetyl-CoA carboxylase biotin carboxylase subunit
MICALSDYVILGIKTQIEFLKDVMEHPEFAAGSTFTDFIPKNMGDWKEAREKKKYLEPALIAVGLDLFNSAIGGKTYGKTKIERQQTSFDPWLTIGKWEIGT